MKKCTACDAAFSAPDWKCPACGKAPVVQDGVAMFAPELAADNDGFDPATFDILYALEAGNFWFRARNRIIIRFIRKYFPDAKNFMEVGCGTGFVLAGLNRAFPSMALTGTEIYSKGLSYAASRLPQGTALLQMDGRKIPFTDEFDLIGAFDCLEHIEEDETVLKEMHRALKPGGGVIFSVPQHPFMWSANDDAAFHKRRYTRNELQQKMQKAGFEVLDSTSFVTLLMPFMMVDRLRKKGGKQAVHADLTAGLKLPAIVNTAFAFVSSVELALIRLGLRMPFGGSRLVVGRKK